jgi:hypothetical protein
MIQGLKGFGITLLGSLDQFYFRKLFGLRFSRVRQVAFSGRTQSDAA